MRQVIFALTLAAAVAQGDPAAEASPAISSEEAHAIGVEAYLYFYPLISMDVTRRQLTNMSPDSGFGGPMNHFANVPALPTADMKAVVRPNFDTLYSSAWLDLSKGPVIVSVPDTGGRYYLLPMLDMWTDVFASPGWRTTGTEAGHFLIAPVGWRPDLRDRFIDEFKLPKDTQRIEAPTPYAWIIGRTKTDGPPDYDAVHKIQAGYIITPLSEWGKTPAPVAFKPDPTIDMTTPPKEEVDTMPAAVYFAYAAELMKTIPPHLTDQAIIARLKRIGFEPDKSFNLYKIDAAIRDELVKAPVDGQKLMKAKVKTLATVVNGWSMNTNTMGVYGNYYLKRAIVAQVGLGANQPEDAIYPLNLGDSAGQPLTGDNDYTLHFDKDQIPPAGAFWSVTLYDRQGFQVANSLNRFAVSSWMPFKYNADGSLDLYFQNTSPGEGREWNWLPTPKEPFNLTMRLYAPKAEALIGAWNPPPVRRTEANPDFAAQ